MAQIDLPKVFKISNTEVIEKEWFNQYYIHILLWNLTNEQLKNKHSVIYDVLSGFYFKQQPTINRNIEHRWIIMSILKPYSSRIVMKIVIKWNSIFIVNVTLKKGWKFHTKYYFIDYHKMKKIACTRQVL